MVGIINPTRKLTKVLFSTWQKLSELQSITDLWMREVRSQNQNIAGSTSVKQKCSFIVGH